MKNLLITTLGLFSLSPIAQAIENTDAEQQVSPIETIVVEGRRNQANTEVSLNTINLSL